MTARKTLLFVVAVTSVVLLLSPILNLVAVKLVCAVAVFLCVALSGVFRRDPSKEFYDFIRKNNIECSCDQAAKRISTSLVFQELCPSCDAKYGARMM